VHLTVYEPLLPQLEGKLCGGLHVDGRGALGLPPLQTLRPYRPEPLHLTTSPPSHTGWGERDPRPRTGWGTYQGGPLARIGRLALAAPGSGLRVVLPRRALGSVVLLVAERGGSALEGRAGGDLGGGREGGEDDGEGRGRDVHDEGWSGGRTSGGSGVRLVGVRWRVVRRLGARVVGLVD